jgi:pimeloyl-ACP methyl ester carboxylesterase
MKSKEGAMRSIENLTSAVLTSACEGDGEFRIAARHWSGGLRLEAPGRFAAIVLAGGRIVSGEAVKGAAGVITLSAADAAWEKLLAAKPPRLYNDVLGLVTLGEMSLDADPIQFAQYYPAVMRAVELLRPAAATRSTGPTLPSLPGSFDSPVGRYIHLEIEGCDYRVYFEEAGSGIPLVLQHTAGCHGSQWRHLFECKSITDHFQLIAYDLPFHGKSLPPTGPEWWADEYRLTGSFLRAVPLALINALGLDRPVFMGCSVGGLLALDLARRNPDTFRAVISLEGALKIETDINELEALWHPQVSNEYKARLMNALMSPTSPVAYRKETSQVYAAGWPPVFLGDLYYYLVDYDLREEAAKIETEKVAVHIFSGEYDPSGSMEHGQAAHAAIPGSTWTLMNDVGHFPMSENPDAFVEYLLPVLERIRTEHDAGNRKSTTRAVRK